MWHVAQVAGIILALGGLALSAWNLSQSPAKVAWELKASSRRSDQIAQEARRRILGQGASRYPRPRTGGPVRPLGVMLLGIAIAVVGTVMHPGGTEVDPLAAGAKGATMATVEGRTTNRTLDLLVRGAPKTNGKRLGPLKPATAVDIVCREVGEAVKRDGRSETTWYRLESPIAGWVTSAYVRVGDDVDWC